MDDDQDYPYYATVDTSNNDHNTWMYYLVFYILLEIRSENFWYRQVSLDSLDIFYWTEKLILFESTVDLKTFWKGERSMGPGKIFMTKNT